MLPEKESLREFIIGTSGSFRDAMDGDMKRSKEKEGKRIPPPNELGGFLRRVL